MAAAAVARPQHRTPHTSLEARPSELGTPHVGLRHQGNTSSLSASAPEGGGKDYVQWIRSWKDEQIAQWLAENKCAAYEQLFRDNDIRGDVLLDVDQQALKEMGIQSVGDRIKMTVAIKKLRQACVAASMRKADLSVSSDPSPQTAPRVAQKSIPPPLHLNSGSRLGQAVQSSPSSIAMQTLSSGSSSASVPQTAVSLSSITPIPSSSSSSVHSHVRKTSSPRVQPGPPAAPAPKSSLPPPPGGEMPTGRPREKLQSAPLQIPAQREVSPNQWQNGSYGLPRAPTDQRGQSGNFAPPVQTSGLTMPPKNTQVHRKAGSLASSSPVGARGVGLQSHATSQSLSQHPYAMSSSPSPTGDAFGPASYYSSSSSSIRPGTAPSTLTLAPMTSGLGQPLLSPIVETLSAGLTSPHSTETPRSNGAAGKVGSARPVTAGAASPSQSHAQSTTVPLEDLMRRTVRFTGPDESGSKMVSVDGARDAAEVLLRVVKRFKLPYAGLPIKTETERGDVVTEIDGWAIFTMSLDQGARVLPDAELIAICSSTGRTERQKGLMVRKVHHPQRDPSRRKLQKFFGEAAPVTPVTPTSRFPDERSSPVLTSDEDEDGHIPRPKHSTKHRASMVSVMSGLLDWNLQDAPPLPLQPTAGPIEQENGPRRLRNFFGHRPPSELISSHLADYFPSAEKKLLRRSIASRRSVAFGRPQSRYGSEGPPTWENQDSSSRFSVSSYASNGDSNFQHAPPVPAKDHYAPAPLNYVRASIDGGRLSTPQIHLTNDDTEKPGDRSSRISASSSRQDSDSGSMLTVDEITAEVEYRRASMVSWHTGDDDDAPLRPRPKSQRSAFDVASPVSEESEEDDDDDDEDGTEDEEDVTEGTADQVDIPEKLTSSGDRSQIKWIKGAVIGTGSFGVVSLGMVATTGMLMAVKQVELPTGSSANEERKRSMLDALQREIELLKTMEHPNIVQYLDSSSDGSHLNIFLEYVPGGSIAALLRNYGAFEEALVSNFIRQILTGLNYLHERDIIHRDIKGANILVDNKGGIKISDFGISKKVEDNLLSTTRMHRPSLQGSVFWMAPEVVKQVPYTSKADIWSIGSVTLEMLTGSHPYPNLSQMQALFRIGSSKTPSPEIPTDITLEAQDFLRQTFMPCVRTSSADGAQGSEEVCSNHMQRPSAAELLEHPFIRPVAESVAPTPTTHQFPRTLNTAG